MSGLANRPGKLLLEDLICLYFTFTCVFLERVLQDGLYYEFCRYSPKAVVRMYGNIPEKLFAVVKYSRSVSTCKVVKYMYMYTFSA